jgi:hypothetical protein
MQDHTTHDTSNEIPNGYCHCGCGQKTKIAPYTATRLGWVKGEPLRYMNGHNRRDPLKPPLPQNTTKLCECGCGQPTKIAKRTISRYGWKKGEPKRFINGHSARKYSPEDGPNPSGLCMCGCGQTTPIATRSVARYGWVKDTPMRYIPWHAPRQKVTVRFWQKVNKRGPNDCWEWTASTTGAGYGTIGIGFKKDKTRYTALAHRLSYELQNGPIPDGLHVCHSCDNPRCVNPAHLWLGTAADNMTDMVAKGRSTQGRSSRKG